MNGLLPFAHIGLISQEAIDKLAAYSDAQWQVALGNYRSATRQYVRMNSSHLPAVKQIVTESSHPQSF